MKSTLSSQTNFGSLEANRQQPAKGFALIATISVMVLLVMVALAMLSLSTIETRQSRQSSNMAEAQANARLALMMAIGDLQKYAGPDQRVTAPASLTGASQHPHWIGAWKTTTGTSDQPVIHWDANGDSLVDERFVGGAYDKLANLQQWLVSGDNASPSSAISGESVDLVYTGSASDTSDHVTVPLDLLQGRNGSIRGGMAYWVSDESTKARLDIANPFRNEQPVATNQGGDGYKRILSPENFGVSSMSGLTAHDSLTPETAGKMLDVSQAALGGMNQASLRENFHALTTRSVGLLTNPLGSGLKGDLSTFIETGTLPAIEGVASSAINDNTPILSSPLRENTGPKYGVLRSWANLATETTSGGEITPRPITETTSSDKYGKYPDFTKQTSQAVHPVIAQATLTTRLCYLRGYLTVHLFPRIVLWNPYNVKLEARQYVLDFNNAVQDSFTVEDRSTSPATDKGSRAYDTRNPSLAPRRMVLTTDPTAFEPGEALVFSPKPTASALAGKAMPLSLRTSNIDNRISAEVDPRTLTNFYIALANFTGVAKTDLPVYANHNRGAYYWVDMMDWWWNNDDNGQKIGLHLLEGSAGNYSNLTSSHTLLQLIDTDNWKRGYQGRFNNGRWKVGGVETIYDYETTSEFLPWARTHYGVRFKWFRETNAYNLAGGGSGTFWHAAPIMNHNLRAALSHRSPYDSVCDNGESHHWYTWGPYAVERQQAMSYNHPDYAAHPGPNGHRANIFFNGGNTGPNHVYPIFDVPGNGYRVHSIGAFRHAQLSQHIWHPSYAVGGSRAPVNHFQREKTAAPLAAMKSRWQSDMPYIPTWLTLQDNASSGTGDNHFLYDLSYEANHALWDSYFLSSATSSEKSAFATDSGSNPLPNSRIFPIVLPDESVIQDGRKAATQLAIRGPFNVNSTNKAAWKALLASFNEVEIPQQSGSASGGTHPYSRFMHPVGATYNNGSPTSEEAWTGYRALTDAQIDALATAIVDEVKLRGPFVSLSDFVNRRLVSASSTDQETGLTGALDAAIANTNLNANLMGGDAAMPSNYAGIEESYNVASRGNHHHFTSSKAEGAPGWLMQGDLLQQLGSVLTARGDTFIVRAYGESRNDAGVVTARAWCEATVQRIPTYLDESDAAEIPAVLPDGTANPALTAVNRQFGRRFIISSFRWLNSTEI